MKKSRKKYSGIIYSVLNKITDKYYIGATGNSMRQRAMDHIERAKRGEGNEFQVALSTYNPEVFTWEQIDTASSIDELAQLEKQYIAEFDSKENGYNMDQGGGVKKSVYQYNLDDGSLVATFDCLQNAGNVVNATKQSISRACLSVNKTYAEFYWSYEYIDPFIPETDKRKKEIIQLDVDGNLIAAYVSVAEASRQIGISKTSISRVCRKEREKTHGFVFKYK